LQKDEGERGKRGEKQELLRRIIFHFPFVILYLSLEEIGSRIFSSMTNIKLQMENEK
jgi:hypothetical protein